MIWEKAKKLASKPFFSKMLGGIASGLGVLIAFAIIKFVGEIVQLLVPKSIIVLGILNKPVPIYVVLIIFVLIFIVFELIKLRKLKLNEKEMFILGILDERELRLDLLFKSYKQRFKEEPRTMSNCLETIKQLEKKKLIKCEVFPGGINDIRKELFQLTKKGQKKFEKLDSIIRKEAENIYNNILATPPIKFEGRELLKRIEPHEEIIFILELLAKQPKKSMKKTALSNRYFKNFKNKKIRDFNIVWNRLETGGLIMEYRASISYGIPDIYSITDNGVVYLRTYKENEV